MWQTLLGTDAIVSWEPLDTIVRWTIGMSACTILVETTEDALTNLETMIVTVKLNGRGRTATCLMSPLLVALMLLQLPDILDDIYLWIMKMS